MTSYLCARLELRCKRDDSSERGGKGEHSSKRGCRSFDILVSKDFVSDLDVYCCGRLQKNSNYNVVGWERGVTSARMPRSRGRSSPSHIVITIFHSQHPGHMHHSRKKILSQINYQMREGNVEMGDHFGGWGGWEDYIFWVLVEESRLASSVHLYVVDDLVDPRVLTLVVANLQA